MATDTDAVATETDAVATDTDAVATDTDAESCSHTNTVVRYADTEVCTKPHFTGCVYCADCGQLLDAGGVAPAEGHRFRYVRQEPDTVMREVVVVTECSVCGLQKRIPLSEYNVGYQGDKKTFADGKYLIVTEGLTPADVLAVCPEDSVLLTAEGGPAAGDQALGTGMTLLFPSSREYTVVLYGDADGDGVITPSDARFALRLSVSLEEHSELRDKACHVENDGKRAVTSADARLILRASVRLEDAALFGREPDPQATPTDATPTDATPTDATPTDATPTDATPTDATPTDATPTDATPTDAEPQPGEYVCQWKGGVNLRADHSKEASPVKVIPLGETVTVTEVCAETETGKTVYWGKITYQGETGWSMLRFFAPTQQEQGET